MEGGAPGDDPGEGASPASGAGGGRPGMTAGPGAGAGGAGTGAGAAAAGTDAGRAAASDAQAADPARPGADARGPGDGGAPPADAGGGLAAPPPIGAPLPVLLIDTTNSQAIPTADKIAGRLRVVYDHDGTLKDVAGRPVVLDTPIGIERRGNTSAGYPQKSYTLELRDSAGQDRALPLLGMPAEADWVLHAPWFDKARVRNALSYALAREISRYHQPRARFVEVLLNGQYNGLYLLVEMIKRDRNRVAIPVPADDAAAGDLSGGYIFRHEAGAQHKPAAMIFTIGTTKYLYNYPKYTKITAPQKTYLQDYVRRFHAMVAGPDWADAAKGYPAWVDLPSFIDSVVVAEMSDCGDCYFKSQYFYKETKANGDKLFKGPVWDFDFAYQAGFSRPPDKVTLLYEINAWGFPLWKRLGTDPTFWNRLRCRWDELRKGPLSAGHINAKIDLLVKEIGPAAEARQRQKWPRASKYSTYTNSSGPMVNGYDSPLDAPWEHDLKFMRDWIARRLVDMDRNLPGKCN
jgi:hypothetical protein